MMGLFDSLREASGPGVAIELAADHVSAASLDMRGGAAVVTVHTSEALPAGALVPSLTAPNVHNHQVVMSALQRVFERTGNPRRVGLIVPDLVAKVSLVRFEHVPARTADLDQLVRWQVRKAAPFPIDEAQVSYVPGFKAADGQEFVVSLARRSVIEEYEGLCTAAGAHPGIVDLATFNVINAVLAGVQPPAGDWLMINVAADYASIAILRGEHLIFFRNRTSDTDGALEDLVHQTAMYYEDRLGGGEFERVLLAGAAGGGAPAAEVERLRRSVEERLARTVENVDPRSAAALTDRISAAPALLDSLAPLVGLLLRGQEAA